jgi:hypothetical protein
VVSSGGIEILDPGATASAVRVSGGGAVELTTVVTGALTIASSGVTSTTTISGVTVFSGRATHRYAAFRRLVRRGVRQSQPRAANWPPAGRRAQSD